jgi:glycosyltransferase involved in cell wall biosynthesis
MFLSKRLPYHKGIGTANLECLACGLPTITDSSNDFFGSGFPIKSWSQFISIESRDPKYLSDLFIMLFRDPDLRKSIGLSGKAFIEDNLTWEKITDLIEIMYKRILAKD